jgi:hypothetical protein
MAASNTIAAPVASSHLILVIDFLPAARRPFRHGTGAIEFPMGITSRKHIRVSLL